MSERTTIPVRLQPRGGRDALVGWRGERLLVRVSAPPVDGRANVALCRLLARELGVARGRIELVQGQLSRDKLVAVDGLDAAAVAAKLPPREP
ncbi:DUF167 domain-containing protein [Patulibacter defluvii]|uniref:DUF167 domain-containing protein n=1 Tax=Patulibacter defluvii TaxID=3095358 RepID=UPI002A754119|nr:DUF167 domain-containing protein [Patulibacter sp. DM4]